MPVDQLALAAGGADELADPFPGATHVVRVRRIGTDRWDAQELGELVEPGRHRDEATSSDRETTGASRSDPGPDRGIVIVQPMPTPPFSLLEFPADDPDRARRFWVGLLGVELEARGDGEGRGWQTHSGGGPELGVHERGTGPGDTFSLPYFAVSDIAATLEQVQALGGSVVHPGEQWAICKDSEGTPFGVALRP